MSPTLVGRSRVRPRREPEPALREATTQRGACSTRSAWRWPRVTSAAAADPVARVVEAGAARPGEPVRQVEARCPPPPPRWSTARSPTRWTSTTPICPRSSTRAPSVVPAALAVAQAGAARRRAALRSRSATRSASGWAWGLRRTLLLTRVLRARPARHLHLRRGGRRGGRGVFWVSTRHGSPTPWASRPAWARD